MRRKAPSRAGRPHPFGAEVSRWLKARGPGYQTRINAVMRAFVRARKRTEALQPHSR
jgi:BrnA antitoxin of type II toxin-antitoxin system